MLPIAPDTLLQQRYRILNLLEEGDLGRTYLAIDGGRSDAYCAIEEIIPTAQSSVTVAQSKEFFQREVMPLYQLQHPQISRLWTTFEEQNRLFLVRDYVVGKTYGQMLEERRDLGTVFSEAEVWQFLLQILPAIGYMHSKGTIHQDIAPAHIICRDRDRLPVFTDFGVLKQFVNEFQSPSGHHLTIGQPGYAPNEQLQYGQISPSTDLYALAVTAIVFLTGKEPSALFDGERMNWDWRKWTQISDEFATILSRMLNADPQERYQSALEVNRALQAIDLSQGQPVPAKQPPANRPSTLPTVALGGKSIPPDPDGVQTAITNLNPKSIWEQPQVFIPVGVLIALLAGIGSWFGVTQLLHRQSADPVATTPPKQIDFNNPTIPTDSSSPSPIASDLIQPEMDRSIVKEGTVDATTPVRYRIAALAGQNLDIQLVPAIAPAAANPTTLPTDPAKSISRPIDPLKPSPSQSTSSTSPNPPISLPSPVNTTQVLMTILSPTGTPIDSQSDRVVGWRGTVPTSGDYTIELRPIKGLSGSVFPYKLSVTQVAVTPSTSPTVTTSPAPGSSLPSGLPVPIDGNGIAPIPNNSNSNSPTNNIPGSIVSPSPTPTPTESERPTRKRRRNRVQTEPTPQVRERQQVESSEETTPTPRRRRNRVESSDEQAAPTPRRRARQPESEPTQPSPSSSPATQENGSKIPVPEPSVAIPVPAAKSGASPGNSTTPSPNSNNIDPD